MKKIDVIKNVVKFVVHDGASKIVHDIIAHNVDMEKTHHKVTVPVASFAIGGAVAEAASTYTDACIDELDAALGVIKNMYNRK